jgi:hypothetical protein
MANDPPFSGVGNDLVLPITPGDYVNEIQDNFAKCKDEIIGVDTRLKAATGPSASSFIEVQKNGVVVPQSPFKILNFRGSGVNAVDISADQVDLTIETGTLVNQVAHGFIVRDVLRATAAGWVLALGDALANSADAIVVAVIDPDNFIVSRSGLVQEIAHGLTANTPYFLSNTIAGAVQTAKSGIGQGILKALDANHWYAALDNLRTGVWGDDYQSAVSAARSTTTSAIFQTKTALVTPALTGTYRIQWSAVIDQDNTGDSVEAQLYNVTDAVVVGAVVIHEPKDVANRFYAGQVDEIVFAGAPKTFEIQYRQQGGNTAGIENARIEIWRVA